MPHQSPRLRRGVSRQTFFPVLDLNNEFERKDGKKAVVHLTWVQSYSNSLKHPNVLLIIYGLMASLLSSIDVKVVFLQLIVIYCYTKRYNRTCQTKSKNDLYDNRFHGITNYTVLCIPL